MPPLKNPYLPSTHSPSQIHPLPLKISLIQLYHPYQKPLIILQNPIPPKHLLQTHPSIHHHYPINYFKHHFPQITQPLQQPLHLFPYTISPSIHIITPPTSHISKPYPFIHLHQDHHPNPTLKPSPKHSFYSYKKLIQTNAQSLHSKTTIIKTR
ncbi:family 1 glycosylhydrolase, partial [Bacillus altitudinis]|uniref:family 1 glycosylhydrolase n=1 Tax=Bacillus altitudinis TaxID=293387 RepID=UPI003B528624